MEIRTKSSPVKLFQERLCGYSKSLSPSPSLVIMTKQKIDKLLEEIDEARKDKEFIRELKIFIKETTS